VSSYKLTTSINLNKILKQKKIKKCISVPFPLGDKRVKSIQTVFSPEFLSKIHEIMLIPHLWKKWCGFSIPQFFEDYFIQIREKEAQPCKNSYEQKI